LTDNKSSYPSQNVSDLLFDAAQKWTDSVAVIHPEGSLSFAQLNNIVEGLCRRLDSEGIPVGSVVGIQLSDPLTHLAWLLALGRSGMPCVPVSVSVGVEATKNFFERTMAVVVITNSVVDFGLHSIKNISIHSNLQGVSSKINRVRHEDPLRIFVYKTSSGTTGIPKIVASTHADMLESIEREKLAIGYPFSERYMTPVDISHDGPRRRFLACLASGGTIVFPSLGSSTYEIAELIDRFQVRHYSCVPIQAYQLATAMAARGRAANLRILRLSAGPSEATLHKMLRAYVTPNVMVSYGCTEIGPMTVAAPGLLVQIPDTVGVVMPGVELEIVDPNGCPVKTGTTGEVRIRTKHMSDAYHDALNTNKHGFRSGWFYPGDIGRLDASGRMYHLGRADDMMIFNGINISPAEIEQVVLAHHAVADAVAMPINRQIINELPVCAVVLAHGKEVSPNEILAWTRQRLGIKSPKIIFILKTIPRTPMGKPIKAELTTLLSSELAKLQTNKT